MLWLIFLLGLKSTRFCVVQIDDKKFIGKNAKMTGKVENAMMGKNRKQTIL